MRNPDVYKRQAEDMEKAVFHLKRAANARNSYAQYQLGKIYLEEDTKNIPAAIQLSLIHIYTHRLSVIPGSVQEEQAGMVLYQ